MCCRIPIDFNKSVSELFLSKEFSENLPNADIWIDRAVLHFLVEEKDILKYFENF